MSADSPQAWCRVPVSHEAKEAQPARGSPFQAPSPREPQQPPAQASGDASFGRQIPDSRAEPPHLQQVFHFQSVLNRLKNNQVSLYFSKLNFSN